LLCQQNLSPAHSSHNLPVLNAFRHIFVPLALLLSLAAGLVYLWRLTEIGLAYKAKVLCSGVFVSGRAAQAVLDEDLASEDLAPLQAFDTRVDLDGKRVEAAFLGLKRRAVYRPETGCSLDAPSDDGAFGPAFAHTGQSPASASRPLPNVPDTPGFPLHLQSRFDPALDWAFAEPDPQHLRRTRAVVVLHRGQIVAERYAPGFGPDMPLAGWSLAKSVMNALVGILVGQGRLDLAAPAAVPEWQAADDPRRQITLDQLMRMVSGLRFTEEAGQPLGDVTQMLMRSPDAAAYAAGRPLQHPPGSLWHYASGTSNLISRIIRDRLGEAEYRAFPRLALFGPLGMGSAVLETDPSGTFVGSSFLYATGRDWAKLGQLYLQDGVFEGRRILPVGWVAYSRRPGPDQRYGAHFWLDIQQEYAASDPEPPLPEDAFHAMGYEGQCVSIIPSKSLVVVRLGLTRQPSAWRQDRFVNKLIAALED